ncbi:hypothetical protein BGW37DRAFT_530523 [Umbelopsis sp. PMI_123]|nr:hypothetical protein BGW37DRAFT_530523 [Umbelopsis sp. PMI_123]
MGSNRRTLKTSLAAYVEDQPQTWMTNFHTQKHVAKALAARIATSPFYQSKRVERSGYHCKKKAKRAEYDKAVDGILRMVGGHVGRRRKPQEEVVIAIGLGDFNTKRNLSSLHTPFGKYFVNKDMSMTLLLCEGQNI